MSINNLRFRPLSWVKQLVLKNKGRRPYKIYFGLFKGLVLNLDMQSQSQVYFGLCERETHNYIRREAHTCYWMIDIGAGQGELCLYFLKSSQAERVIAFEPQASEIDIIRSNLLLNEEHSNQHITVLGRFVGTSNDPSYLSLDALELDKDKRGFIKIDVDGREMDVLKSGEGLLSEGNVDLLVETHSQELEDDCFVWLTNKGYHCKIIGNAWWRFIAPEQRPIAHNRWLWATRDEQGVAPRAPIVPETGRV